MDTLTTCRRQMFEVQEALEYQKAEFNKKVRAMHVCALWHTRMHT